MRAVVYDAFGELPTVREVPDPAPGPRAALLRVTATGVCRSDWHAWRGHDSGIRLPHVPGHELAGVVVAVGEEVRRFRPGQRVTATFLGACGRCEQCVAGEQEVCAQQVQPGFTTWGSFADLVVVEAADVNLVALPDAVDDEVAAALGCRVATSYRAVVAHGRPRPGQWVAVHGCGGVGLSAVLIAKAAGARVVAVDISEAALALAARLGADLTYDGSGRAPAEVAAAVRDLTSGGAHVSLDALGSQGTCEASVACLRPRGRHVQVGLLLGAQARPAVPMDLVVARELEIVGSHGMAARHYPELLALVESGALPVRALIAATVGLDDAPAALAAMDGPTGPGITVVRP